MVIISPFLSGQVTSGSGAGGDKSLGNSHFAPILARAAAAAGANGFFFETHPDPSVALSDGPNMVLLDKMEETLESVMAVKQALKNSQAFASCS